MNKLLEVINSVNFKITLISVFTLFVNGQGITIDSPEDLYAMFANKSFQELLIPIFTFSVNILGKLALKIKDKTLDLSVFKSTNFLTQAASVVALLLGVFLNFIPTAIIVTILLNIINTVFHISSPVKAEEVKTV